MKPLGWHLVDLVSRALDPEEREAVRGDLAESGESAVMAVAAVIGLVVRRQAESWRHWHPWVAFVALVVPLGLVLGVETVWIGRSYDLYLWIFRNYTVIDPNVLRESGLRIAPGAFTLACHSALVVAWSWSGGFVLGALSRRAIRINGPLFCMILLAGERWAAPRPHYYVAGAVFARALSSMMLPGILLALLVLPPAIWGMRAGRRHSCIRLLPAMGLAAAIAGLTVVSPMPLWWCNWPAAYMLIAACRQHGRPIPSA